MSAAEDQRSDGEETDESEASEDIKEVTMRNAMDTASAVWEIEGKTPLILNECGLIDKCYADRGSGSFIDAKSLFLRESMENIPHEVIMEELRSKLVNAMQSGHTLVVSMESNSAEIVGRFSGKRTFPVPEVFIPDRIRDERVWFQFVKETEKFNPETNVRGFIIKKGFEVVVTSRFAIADYQRFLEEVLPLNHCRTLFLK